MKLEGKVALVTGGAQGSGFAAASALARDGAVVAIADIDAQGANAAAAKLRAAGARAHGFLVDIADPRSVQTLFKDLVAQLGRLDILVNNAGGAIVAEACAKQMVAQGGGGRIMNIADIETGIHR